MKELSKFKNKIFIYGALIMVAMEVISLPFLGLDLKFAYGLLLGTAVTVVNFNILAFTMSRVLNGSNKFLATVSYIFRLFIYGGVFLMAYNAGQIAGLGSVLGFLTIKLSVVFVHGIKPGFKWVKTKRGGEAADKKQNFFIREPYQVKYCRGRAIMTYKKLPDYSKR